jgi:hypothetical protein
MSIDSCRSFKSFLSESVLSANKIGFLVLVFKILHENAPTEDFKTEVLGGKIAQLWKLCNKDTGRTLKIIWDSSSVFPVGSHLDYMLGIVKKNDYTNKNNAYKPKVDYI